MKHKYNITGMTCTNCEDKVKSLLKKVKGIKDVTIDLKMGSAEIEMDTHISIEVLNSALKDYPQYQISMQEHTLSIPSLLIEEDVHKSWGATYKPILLIFAYILTISLIGSYNGTEINFLTAMRIFMAGFFITFSFFKMLDLKGFTDSYAMYDIVAKRFRTWGYIYAFVELGLGLAYATNFQPEIINYITLVVMSVSIIGVLQSVLNKRKIKCACLGAVFNLPMSTVTIVEDSLMIAMSAIMLFIMS